MKKVYCDICKKEIDTIYGELIMNNRVILEFCKDCGFHISRHARNLRESKENAKTGDEDS